MAIWHRYEVSPRRDEHIVRELHDLALRRGGPATGPFNGDYRTVPDRVLQEIYDLWIGEASRNKIAKALKPERDIAFTKLRAIRAEMERRQKWSQ